MIGPKSVPPPNSTAVTKALDLLVMMGGNSKSGPKLLKEMQSVQQHNEKLLVEVKNAINESMALMEKIRKEQAAFARHQSAIAEKSRLANEAFAKREEVLAGAINDYNRDARTRNDDIDARLGEVVGKERSLSARTKKTTVFENALNQREKAIERSEAANSALRAELNQRDQRLQAAMGR